MTAADLAFLRTAEDVFLAGVVFFLIGAGVWLTICGVEMVATSVKAASAKRKARELAARKESERIGRLQRDAAISAIVARERATRRALAEQQRIDRDLWVLLCASAPNWRVEYPFASADAAIAWAKTNNLIGRVALTREKQADAAILRPLLHSDS